ncbi:hypothetical protein BLGI_4442 [Brevibacillus laterosporus GI-9]|uniref:hypothetical protein n=1 Tax=Brevibacillus laterosporus TaxID=1465 RepID=UPI0002405403|nr:hypothetical protein [Brevibacillus laterosporus]CCF16473.1 hypothetical protein BLGI_4442 [Brevibacillus laterosporus GI-9]
MKKISEFNKSVDVVNKRLSLIKEQGYWECDKCGTRYFAGTNCDPCMAAEFRKSLGK